MLLKANLTFPSTDTSPESRDPGNLTLQHEALRLPKAPRRKGRKAWARRTPPGAPPGTLLPDPKAPPPVIRVIAYGPDTCRVLSLHPQASMVADPCALGNVRHET